MPCSTLMPSACSVPSGPAGLPDTDDPASHAEMADSLSLAFLVLLETVSPEQRAAFLLREVFDYPYDQIAAIVTTSEQNARQLVARARPARPAATAPLRAVARATGTPGPAAGRGTGGGYDDRGARLLQRQGQVGTRLGAALPLMAAGLQGGALSRIASAAGSTC
jgi:hypothetical protein